jgi:hypothetical protein
MDTYSNQSLRSVEQQSPYSEDIVDQHLNKSFNRKITLDIERHPYLSLGTNLPGSYVKYIKSIINTLSGGGLVVTGYGDMFINIFSDMAGGGYLNISSSDKTLSLESAKTTDIVNKMIKGSEKLGQSLLTRTDGDIRVYQADSFFYNSTDNILYTTERILYRGTDTLKCDVRYVKKIRGKIIVYIDTVFINNKTYNITTKITTKITPIVSDDPLLVMGANIITNNREDTNWVGLSAIHDINTLIRGMSLTLQEYNKAMYYTSPTTYIMNNLIETDIEGNPTIDLTQDTIAVVDGSGIEDPRKMMETVQYEFYAESFHRKLTDDMLTALSVVGLDQSMIALEGVNIERSATEINSEDNRSYATIEHRRTMYLPQLRKLISLINLNILGEVEVTYVPVQSFNAQMNTNITTTQYQAGLISRRDAIKALDPKLNEEQVENRIRDIEQEEEKKAELNLNDSNSESQDLNGYDTTSRTGVKRGSYD